MTIIRVAPGLFRMIHDDDYVPPGAVARRASHVEPVEDGPQAGRWTVTVGGAVSDHPYCLPRTYPTRRSAIKAEIEHLEREWIGTCD
jgi:hypothetical protein